ncbi:MULTISPECIES: hypothetical protein [unclassified Vibrio]|uniref:hypothetical protein n=1 Tax=unclassified Vibrio TaxID=2614977 RepID=UPI0029649E2F|nr:MULTISPECIES: hypothetical protein [unclassified Vibrio]MDW1746579.1 hypothetical protein [Vibrio sp. Vb2531]MDW3641939.1 hypothetical protein [Vibrio sp. 1291-1]
MKKVIVPELNSEPFKGFVKELNLAVSRSELAANERYEDHFEPQSLRFLKQDAKYPEGNCWHNCYRYVYYNSGQVVFGWLIFEIVNDRFVAQNHAVVRGDDGNLFDPTHCSVVNTNGVFVPDLRAKIQYENLRAPGSFELLESGRKIWTDGKGESENLMYRKFGDSKQLQDHIAKYVTDI